MTELKPCPFCGETIALDVTNTRLATDPYPKHWAFCKTCDATTGGKKSIEDAIAAWNKRVGWRAMKQIKIKNWKLYLIIETLFFVLALVLFALVDWRLGIGLFLYETNVSMTIVREIFEEVSK